MGYGLAVAQGEHCGGGVGVGVAAATASKAWPVLTGGAWPPLVSHPNTVKQFSSNFWPTTNWLSFPVPAGLMLL